MEFRNILTFLKIAEVKSFTKAAEELGYAQSTVTMQIKQLENDLGFKLFERIGKTITLTEKGIKFQSYAYKIIKTSYQAKLLSNDPLEPEGLLRIGVIESISTSIFLMILDKYHRLYPNVKVIIKISTTLQLLEMLNCNAVDIIYTLDNMVIDTDYINAYNHMDKICFVCSKNSSLTSKISKLEDLVNISLVLTEKGCNYRNTLEEQLANHGKYIEPFLEIGSTNTILDFLKNNDCVSLLPEFTVKNSIINGDILNISIPDCDIVMWRQLIYHKDKWLTPQMNKFIELIKTDTP